MLPPGPPRNEKKRSGIQLTLAPGPLLFVPTPLDMSLFRVTAAPRLPRKHAGKANVCRGCAFHRPECRFSPREEEEEEEEEDRPAINLNYHLLQNNGLIPNNVSVRGRYAKSPFHSGVPVAPCVHYPHLYRDLHLHQQVQILINEIQVIKDDTFTNTMTGYRGSSAEEIDLDTGAYRHYNIIKTQYSRIGFSPPGDTAFPRADLNSPKRDGPPCTNRTGRFFPQTHYRETSNKVQAFAPPRSRPAPFTNVLGGREEGFGEGRGNLSPERFPLPSPIFNSATSCRRRG